MPGRIVPVWESALNGGWTFPVHRQSVLGLDAGYAWDMKFLNGVQRKRIFGIATFYGSHFTGSDGKQRLKGSLGIFASANPVDFRRGKAVIPMTHLTNNQYLYMPNNGGIQGDRNGAIGWNSFFYYCCLGYGMPNDPPVYDGSAPHEDWEMYQFLVHISEPLGNDKYDSFWEEHFRSAQIQQDEFTAYLRSPLSSRNQHLPTYRG